MITNKTTTVPSKFNNINLIKNALKAKANKMNSRKRKFMNLSLLQNAIKNNLKIIFNLNDETGVLEFTLKLGYNVKTYTINGFKTSSS